MITEEAILLLQVISRLPRGDTVHYKLWSLLDAPRSDGSECGTAAGRTVIGRK